MIQQVKGPMPVGSRDSNGLQPPIGITDQRSKHYGNGETVISGGMILQGDVKGVGRFRILGRIEGTVDVKGDLIIEAGSHISGDVHAENVMLGGEVDGNLYASGKLELSKSGVVMGDLRVASLIVAAGASICGKIECGQSEQKSNKVVPFETVGL